MNINQHEDLLATLKMIIQEDDLYYDYQKDLIKIGIEYEKLYLENKKLFEREHKIKQQEIRLNKLKMQLNIASGALI